MPTNPARLAESSDIPVIRTAIHLDIPTGIVREYLASPEDTELASQAVAATGGDSAEALGQLLMLALAYAEESGIEGAMMCLCAMISVVQVDTDRAELEHLR